MKLHRLVFGFAIAVVILVGPTVGANELTHLGWQSPLTEGFECRPKVVAGSANLRDNGIDPPTPVWTMDSIHLSHTPAFYSRYGAFDGGQDTEGSNRGWTVEACVEVVDIKPGDVPVTIFANDGRKLWDIGIGMHETHFQAQEKAPARQPVEPGFHVYQIIYDPNDQPDKGGTVTYLLDGEPLGRGDGSGPGRIAYNSNTSVVRDGRGLTGFGHSGKGQSEAHWVYFQWRKGTGRRAPSHADLIKWLDPPLAVEQRDVALSAHFKHVFAQTAAGRHDLAEAYVDALRISLGEHVAKSERALAAGREADDVWLAAPQVRMQLIEQRLAADMAAAAAGRGSGQLTQDAWRDTWAAISERAGSEGVDFAGVLLRLAFISDPRTQAELRSLLEADLPGDFHRDVVAAIEASEWNGVREDAGALSAWCTDLLAYAADTPEGVRVLKQCVAQLDALGASARADDLLDVLIPLFADVELGAAAARLRLGGLGPSLHRDRVVMELVEQYRGSAVARGLGVDHVMALIRRGESADVYSLLDEDGGFSAAPTPRLKAALIVDRINQLFASPRIEDVGRARATPAPMFAASAAASGESLARLMAEHLLTAGDAATAGQLALFKLAAGKAAPIHLSHGVAVTELSELGDMQDVKHAAGVVRFLLGVWQYRLVSRAAGDAAMHELLASSPPEALKAYVWQAMARRAAAARDYEAAGGYVDQLLAAQSGSRVAEQLKQTIAGSQQKQHERQAMVSRVRDHLRSARLPLEADEVIAHYEAAAALQLKLEQFEEAANSYLLICDSYPDHGRSPLALAAAIRVLRSTGTPAQAARATRLAERLAKQYPDAAAKGKQAG